MAREARGRVQEGKVTYNWWMQWNTKMVDAVDKDPKISLTSIPAGNMISDMAGGTAKSGLFEPDEVILLPTTKELGFMAFNQVSSKKLSPVGLVNQVTKADGFPLSPLQFLDHDIDHSKDIARGLANYKPYKHFHKSFRERVKQLPKDRREKAETLLFMLTHEYPETVRSVSQFTDLSDHHLFSRTEVYFNDMEQLLPSPMKDTLRRSKEADYKNAVIHYYKSAAQEFETIARDIQNGR